MPDFIQVTTTIDTQEGAQKIADAMVSARLAACVQIAGPIMSTYWWQGAIETAQEWICVAKTRMELYDRVEQCIRAEHSYDEPEIIATPLVAGSQGYFDWICRETD